MRGGGRFWMHVHRQAIGFYVARVISESNPADLPTRGDDSLALLVDATFCAPMLPGWIDDIWRPWSWAIDGVTVQISPELLQLLQKF